MSFHENAQSSFISVQITLKLGLIVLQVSMYRLALSAFDTMSYFQDGGHYIHQLHIQPHPPAACLPAESMSAVP